MASGVLPDEVTTSPGLPASTEEKTCVGECRYLSPSNRRHRRHGETSYSSLSTTGVGPITSGPGKLGQWSSGGGRQRSPSHRTPTPLSFLSENPRTRHPRHTRSGIPSHSGHGSGARTEHVTNTDGLYLESRGPQNKNLKLTRKSSTVRDKSHKNNLRKCLMSIVLRLGPT